MIAGSVIATLIACTLSENPLTLEQRLQQVEQVVLVKAVRAAPGKGPRGVAREDRHDPAKVWGTVTFEVVQVFSGKLAARELTFAGQVDRYEGRNPGKPQEQGIRRGGRHGSCFAYDYRLGGLFLLLLKGGTPYWAPLEPMNEEVSGPDDLWVKWVREHIAR